MAIGTPVEMGTHTQAAGSADNNIVVTAAASAGDLVVVWVGVGPQTAAASLSSVADTRSNTWTAESTIGGGSGSGASRLALAWSILTTGIQVNDNITVTHTSTNGLKFASALKITGIAASTPRDVYGAGTTATGTAPSIATGTLAQADEIVLGGVFLPAGAADTYTESSGFTSDTAILSTGALRNAYEIVAATTTQTFAPTLGTSRVYIANVATFKGASAGDTLMAQAIF